MEIGTAISHKIRSAIKAKLVELGAYVDEELPDYIMVMVANKKSLKQMTEDLELFLAAKTEVFTSWLHELLKKLQSIGSDPQQEVIQSKSKKLNQTADSADDNKSAEQNQEQKENEKKNSEISAESIETDQYVEGANEPGEIVDEIEIEDKTSKVQAQEAPDIPTENSQQPAVISDPPSVEEAVIEEDIEPELLVRADTDEFNEELQIEETKKITKASEPKSRPTRAGIQPEESRTDFVKKGTVIPTREIINSQSDKRTSVTSRLGYKQDSRPRAVASPIKQVSSSSRTISVSRKRRGPTSIVGSIIHNPDEEEEEEYDPLNPAVGNVASVVKVTARKSSVPKSLQANKSLLMRAVSEAEKSVTLQKPSGTKSSASQMVVRPLRRDEQPSDRIYEPTIKLPKLQLTSKSRQEDIYRKMKYTIDNEQDSPKFVIRKEEVYQPTYVTRPFNNQPTYITRQSDSQPIYITRPSDNQPVYITHPSDNQPTYITRPSDNQPTYITRPSDNRVVEYIPQPVIVIKQEEFSSDDEVVEISPPEEKPIVLEDTEEEYDVKPKIIASRLIKDRPLLNPKFVVTLDGIDPEEFDGDTEPESDTSMSNQMMAAADTPVNIVSTPKVKPFNINLRDSDDECDEDGDVEMTPLKQAKAAERCKFWPACVNGNSCQYHHPTLPCKTFPHCKFSDKCLYIHPNCKYDAKCSRHDCPYTHASRRMSTPIGIPPVIIPRHQVILTAPPTYKVPPSSVKKQCIYYPNCTNMNCPFSHPTPCRFGMICKNRFCSYYHPSLPSKDKLKWSARTSTESAITKEVSTSSS